MRTAFKEWTIIVDALNQGDQILILRKGGIREGKAGFQVVADRFWLFPTQFHQQREAVIESAQQRYDRIRPAETEEDTVRVESFVEVVASHQVADWNAIAQLNDQHVWRESVIRERFDWGQEKAVFALIVRVYRAAEPVTIPMLPKYGGCRSWVELETVPEMANATPVLGDADFQARLEPIQSALGT